MQFSQLVQLFPLILAPGVIALARRQKRLAWLDGPVLVWSAVVGAAVLWTLLLALAYSEPITRGVVARGVLLGLLSACADTWATRKAKPAEGASPAQQTPSAAPTAPLDSMPSEVPAVAMDLDFEKDPK